MLYVYMCGGILFTVSQLGHDSIQGKGCLGRHADHTF
jgi:hypothetical protein